ncbi:MAG TPA: hypothetical protein VIV58_30515 [Kofleriaceae bacterium]
MRRASRRDVAKVYRIQDHEGRGPFRPGFSQTWLDDVERVGPPTWMEEFGWDAAREAPDGAQVFSAVRTISGIRKWFSDTERPRLYALGYRLVEVPNAVVIRESEHQLLCWRGVPLSMACTFRSPV